MCKHNTNQSDVITGIKQKLVSDKWHRRLKIKQTWFTKPHHTVWSSCKHNNQQVVCLLSLISGRHTSRSLKRTWVPSGDTRLCLPFQYFFFLFSSLLSLERSFWLCPPLPPPPSPLSPSPMTSHSYLGGHESQIPLSILNALPSVRLSILYPPLFLSLFSYLHLSFAFLPLSAFKKQEAEKRRAGPLCVRPQFVLSQVDTALKSRLWLWQERRARVL